MQSIYIGARPPYRIDLARDCCSSAVDVTTTPLLLLLYTLLLLYPPLEGYGNEMWMFQLIRSEPFSGDRGSAYVDDFLDTLELTFLYPEYQVADTDKRQRAKMFTLQSHLEGKAKAFLIALRPASKVQRQPHSISISRFLAIGISCTRVLN